MLKLILTMTLTSVLTFPLFSPASHADVITLHIPVLEDSPDLHLFFHELLEASLKEAGHTPKLIPLWLPQARIREYFDDGILSIYWMVQSRERDAKYNLIDVGLTNGLIGKRILFIKRGDQHRYDNVQTLEDFRALNLVAGIGVGWFDVKVWKANQLRFKEHSGNWKALFEMVPLGRSYGYFSRGINEILNEAAKYEKLGIENRLVLIYDRDFKFYLSESGINSGSQYKHIIENALKNAEQTGLIKRLMNKYWARDFKTLNYQNRIQLHLQTPK